MFSTFFLALPETWLSLSEHSRVTWNRFSRSRESVLPGYRSGGSPLPVLRRTDQDWIADVAPPTPKRGNRKISSDLNLSEPDCCGARFRHVLAAAPEWPWGPRWPFPSLNANTSFPRGLGDDLPSSLLPIEIPEVAKKIVFRCLFQFLYSHLECSTQGEVKIWNRARDVNTPLETFQSELVFFSLPTNNWPEVKLSKWFLLRNSVSSGYPNKRICKNCREAEK